MRPLNNARKKLWELPHNFQCSIIGTCLTLEEARKIGRKFGAVCDDPSQLDATIHTFIVREAGSKNMISIHVDRFLNEKFEGMIRRFKETSNPPKILSLWRECRDVGVIPAGYWAAVTHPALDPDGLIRVFSDVHMLSHINGGNNVEYIQQVVRKERELEKLITQNKSTSNRLAKKEAELNNQIEQNSNEINRLRQDWSLRISKDNVNNNSLENKLTQKTKKLESINGTLKERLCNTERELAAAVQIIRLRDTEIEAFKKQINEYENYKANHSDPTDRRTVNFKLSVEGLTFLYVGGNTKSNSKLNQFVGTAGASLKFYDKQRTKSLKALVKSSNAVFLPTDKVSHSDALETNKLCRLCGVPFFPLKSCSLSCFQNALRSFHNEIHKEPNLTLKRQMGDKS